jgi:hypothetical protein
MRGLVALSICVLGCGNAGSARTRPIEGRLSEGDWRPYVRGVERTSLAEQAALENDPAALARVQLLQRDEAAAEAAFAHAQPSAQVTSDRAVLDLLRGHADQAIARLEGPVDAKLEPAVWNRALALESMGLELGAAQEFSQVAAAGEPGWSTEAAFRAEALRQKVALGRAAQRQVTNAGVALFKSATLPDAALVRRYPSSIRYYFNHAVRSAETADAERALAPLAKQLDEISGGDHLRRLVDWAAGRDFAVRAPLAREYRRLNALGGGPQKDRDAFFAAVRRAGEQDILLLGLVAFGGPGVDLDELARLARGSEDPFFTVLVDGKRAEKLRDPAAAALLHETLDRCHAARLAYRCVPIASQLVGALIGLHQTAEADRIGRAAFAESQRELPVPSVRLLFQLADVARLRLDLPLMRAFLEEGALRSPGDCVVQRASHEMLATGRMFAFDDEKAVAELQRAPRCDQPITLLRADLLADLARRGVAYAEQEKLAADLEAARAGYSAGQRTQADAILGRFTINRDRAAGRALLHRALDAANALPPDDVDARKAASYARLSLAVEAQARGAPEEALEQLAQLSGGHAGPCSVGLAVDDVQLLRITKGPSRPAEGRLVRLTSPTLQPSAFIDAQTRHSLDGCEEVAVFAAAPVHGLPRILPPELAWSYRGPSRPVAPSPTPARRLVVADVVPPPELGLPRLQPYVARDVDKGALILRGPEANPTQVLDALARATEVELHTHGLVDLERSDASLLVLSRGKDGRTSLTAGEIRARPLTGWPVVAIGACRAARVATWLHDPWSLPEAFLAAGARAVIASPEPIPDAAAGAFFAGVTARIRDGATPARALRDERMKWRARDPWVDDVLVFE